MSLRGSREVFLPKKPFYKKKILHLNCSREPRTDNFRRINLCALSIKAPMSLSSREVYYTSSNPGLTKALASGK